MHRSLTIVVVLLLVVMAYGCSSSRSSTSPSPTEVKDVVPVQPSTPDRQVSVGGGNGKPVSVPGATPTQGGVPLQVHFYDAGSYDPGGGDIVKWEWNFSDKHEGKGGWHDFTSTQGDAWHTYTKAGRYKAHLRVVNENGKKGIGHIRITLDDELNANPVAVANADPLYGDAPLEVSFSAIGSYDPDGTIVMWEWDFDDGSGFQDFTSTAGTTSHEYTVSDLYTAILRVTDDDGAVATDSVLIDVTELNLRGDWWMFGHDAQHTHRSIFIGPPTNTLKWAYTTGSYVRSSPSLGSDGTVYVGSWDHKLYAINPDGSLKWAYATGDRIAYSSPAIGTDGTVYIVSRDTKLHAVNPDGTSRWTYIVGDFVESSPAISEDGTVYVGSRVHNKLYAINPDGSLKWAYATGDYTNSSPAIGTDGTVYIGSRDGNLYAVNPDGSLKWAYATGAEVRSPAIGLNGTIHVVSWPSKLYAVNPDGSLKWTSTAVYAPTSAAIGDDGAIYVGSGDKKLYAINSDGSLRWAYTTGNQVRSTPAIDGAGVVYVGSQDGKIYAVNPDGSLKWTYTTLLQVESSPAIGPDGTVYVGGVDSKLYAIGPGGT